MCASCKVFLFLLHLHIHTYVYFLSVYTQEAINYAELDPQKGPSRFGGGEHVVNYDQVTEAKKLKKVIEKLMWKDL